MTLKHTQSKQFQISSTKLDIYVAYFVSKSIIQLTSCLSGQ